MGIRVDDRLLIDRPEREIEEYRIFMELTAAEEKRLAKKQADAAANRGPGAHRG